MPSPFLDTALTTANRLHDHCIIHAHCFMVLGNSTTDLHVCELLLTPSSFRKTMDAVYCLCSFTIMIDIWAVYLSHTASSLPHTGGFHQFWSFLQRLWESNCASAVPSQRDCISLPRGHSEPRSFSSQTGEDLQTCVYVTYLLQHSIGRLHVTCAHEHTNVL